MLASEKFKALTSVFAQFSAADALNIRNSLLMSRITGRFADFTREREDRVAALTSAMTDGCAPKPGGSGQSVCMTFGGVKLRVHEITKAPTRRNHFAFGRRIAAGQVYAKVLVKGVLNDQTPNWLSPVLVADTIAELAGNIIM